MSLSVRGVSLPGSALRASETAFTRGVSRLSSGLRLQTAADDAAGLAVSERMRSQVVGSAMAIRNVHDGIGMLQTADGGMAAITGLLQRARELAVQALSTGTTTQADRDAAAAEVRQLVGAIDRTAGTTRFNGHRLLDGSRPTGFALQVGARGGDVLTASTADLSARALTLSGAAATPSTLATSTALVTVTDHTAVSEDFSSYVPAKRRTWDVVVGGTAFSVSIGAGTYSPEELAGLLRAGLGSDPPATVSVVAGQTPGTSRLELVATAARGGSTTTIDVSAGGRDKIDFTVREDDRTVETEVTSVVPGTPGTASLADLVAAGSDDALALCEAALGTVLSARADVGALQNRLEHRLGVLAAAEQNTAEARSRIVDADVAKEWAGVVRAQVLAQAGTAMQSQASAGGQRVLQLLGSL